MTNAIATTDKKETAMTNHEYLATRDRLLDEVLSAPPGEERLKAFAKLEHIDSNQPDMVAEITYCLCFMLTKNRFRR
jgi:hypothetical protein